VTAKPDQDPGLRLDEKARWPMVILTLAAVALMAVAVLVLAWGSDGSTPARAAVGGATGPLIADSLGGGAILNASNLAPGQAITGEVNVTNVGDAAGDMALGTSDLADATVRGGVLSRMLDITVLDVTAGRAPALVYAGKVVNLQSVRVHSFEQGESRGFRFTVAYPAGQSAAVDDAYQGAATRVSFVWTATGAGGGGTDNGGAANGNVDVPPADVGAIIEDHVEQSSNPARLKLRIYVRRIQAVHRKRVDVNAYCSHHCALTASGTVSLPSQKRRWRARPLKGTVKKNGTVKFQMALPKKALPVLNRARVSIAPLRVGAGMKGKIGEALAAGLPVVGSRMVKPE